MRRRTEEIAWERLTAREREVVERILRGETIKEIAQAIGRSPKTAEFHVRNVLWKIHVSSRRELLSRMGTR
jgi:two-component system nitrate/nitrite response regulator NarL